MHRTKGDVLLPTSSGTGAMEGAVANICSPGDRVLFASAGNFGERWMSLAEAYGCEVVPIRYEWGETPNPDEVAPRSTRQAGPAPSSRPRAKPRPGSSSTPARSRRPPPSGALTVVDAISSLAAVPLETEAWGIDVVVAGSQKALMTPPGLATTAVSPARWRRRSLELARGTTSTGGGP